MPCQVSESEKRYYEAERLLSYAKEHTGYASKLSRDPTQALCALLTALPQIDRERLIYNARDRDSRRLADWWEDHCEKDEKRKRKKNT